MFYDNIKSQKKTPEFHPLFGRYIFTEKPEGGRVKLTPQPFKG